MMKEAHWKAGQHASFNISQKFYVRGLPGGEDLPSRGSWSWI